MNNPAVWDHIITKNKPAKWLVCFIIMICILINPVTLHAESSKPAAKALPKIAIIIDDIGYNRPAGEHIINIPGALTYAVIPFTPFGKRLAELAHSQSKEVLLHLPMEATYRKKLDTGGLTVHQSKYELKDLVNNSLAAVPHVSGFNNHMGSLLTTDRKAMEWIMEEASSLPLFFVDSVTNPNSIAGKVASEHDIPNLRRDVFLDNSPSEQEIHSAFLKLIARAKKNQFAIGIAHPHPGTIKYLSTHIPNLKESGVELVSVSELITAWGYPETTTLSTDRLVHLVASLPAPIKTRFRFEL